MPEVDTTTDKALILEKFLSLAAKAGYKKLAFNCTAWDPWESYNGKPMGSRSVFSWPDIREDDTWPMIWRIVDACKVSGGGGGSQQYCLESSFADWVGPCVWIRTRNKWKRTEGRIVGELRDLVRKHLHLQPTWDDARILWELKRSNMDSMVEALTCPMTELPVMIVHPDKRVNNIAAYRLAHNI